MIYVKDGYNNYKYLVDVSDNYVCLTNQRTVDGTWENPREIDVIYQYINSPYTVIETTRDYNYSTTFEQIDISHNIFDSPAYPQYTTNVLIVVLFILYIINPITKLVKKGGIFFGS